jgi:hypothetical protein
MAVLMAAFVGGPVLEVAAEVASVGAARTAVLAIGIRAILQQILVLQVAMGEY